MLLLIVFPSPCVRDVSELAFHSIRVANNLEAGPHEADAAAAGRGRCGPGRDLKITLSFQF